LVVFRHRRAVKMGSMQEPDPIDVYIPGDGGDPRRHPAPPDGVRPHYGPPLHPDDVTVVHGVPVTSVSRTLIDLAEVLTEEELRECFLAAHHKGLLDLNELSAARARVEWRPSLAMLDRVVADFD
jgi:hypothetical protein